MKRRRYWLYGLYGLIGKLSMCHRNSISKRLLIEKRGLVAVLPDLGEQKALEAVSDGSKSVIFQLPPAKPTQR